MHQKYRPPSAERRCGIALVWTALLLLALIGIVGLACDWAYALLVAHELQNAADAASLAAAQTVKSDQAASRAAAVDLAGLNSAAGRSVLISSNDGNAADGDVVIGRFDRGARTFTPDTASPNAVKVVARRTTGSLGGPLPLLFGPIFGASTSEVSRHAIAMSGGGTGAGLICLNPTKKDSLNVFGTTTLDVNGGAIQVNSSNAEAIWTHGTPVIDAPEINVLGGANLAPGTFSGDLNLDSSPVPDPLAFLPPPSWDPAAPISLAKITNGQTQNIGPGYYPDGIWMTGGTLNMAPGIYVLDGMGFNVTGGSITGLGIMLYVKGSGVVDITGNPAIHLTPPDPSDPALNFPGAATYEGVTIFQARDDTNPSRIVGTSLMDIEGTLYFPSNTVDLGGTGDGFGNQLIADSLTIHGTGTITINYDGRFPAVGNKVFLVW